MTLRGAKCVGLVTRGAEMTITQKSWLERILNLIPNIKNGDGEEYVSLKLQLSRSSLRHDTVVQAVFKFFIYDHIYRKHTEQQVVHHFETLSPFSESICMIPLKTLKSSSSGFVVDDSCICGVEFIKVMIVISTDTTSENLLIQKSNTFADRGMYSWIIEGFTTPQTPCNSPTFVIGGYKWYQASGYQDIYHGCGWQHKFSLLVPVSVRYAPQKSWHTDRSQSFYQGPRKWQPQETSQWSKTTRCELSMKAKGCGRGCFISLQDLKDTSKGYIVKGKCCIEAEISIIAASTMA